MVAVKIQRVRMDPSLSEPGKVRPFFKLVEFIKGQSESEVEVKQNHQERKDVLCTAANDVNEVPGLVENPKVKNGFDPSEHHDNG